MEQDEPAGYRIAAVVKMTGVGVHTIRAWERRYGVPVPDRSTGGHRLYSGADIDAIRRMAALARDGMSLPSAARLVLTGGPAAAALAPTTLSERRERLISALLSFDEPAAAAIWGDVLAISDVVRAMEDLAVPVLREIGDRWHRGEATVAQEHFATQFIRARLDTLSRQFPAPRTAPAVLLTCLPGERHEVALLMLAVLVRHRGLRPVYLGADVPLDTIVRTALDLPAAVIAVHALAPESGALVRDLATQLNALSPASVVYGGPAFDPPAALQDLGPAVYGGTSLNGAVETIDRLARQFTPVTPGGTA
ncbi:MAG: MerR family transcriptional regulator [Tepidiformaceae bacterium]